MNKDIPTLPLEEVVAAIHSRAFKADLVRYVAHAAFLLKEKGMGEGEYHLPGAIEVCEVVNDTVADCLAGVRKWKEGDAFSKFFRGALRSEVFHGCRRARRRREDRLDDTPEPPVSSRCIDLWEERRELAEVREVLSGDPRTKALLDAIEDGADKRAEVAEKLGWKPEYVSQVRTLARHRLAVARAIRDQRDKKAG